MLALDEEAIIVKALILIGSTLVVSVKRNVAKLFPVEPITACFVEAVAELIATVILGPLATVRV